MDYEKKYKEAIERAKSKIKNDKDHVLYENDVIDIFPKLYESEDEMIRKAIIEHFTGSHSSMFPYKGFTKEQILAWLEKQGEQIDIANKEYWRGYREGKQETLDKYAELEKQSNEEKPQVYKTRNGEVITYSESKGYKVAEPKFHEGDFIKHNKANLICKVISVNSGSYCVENIETSCRIELFYAEQKFHLWTIEDAKEGDVLATDTFVFIFKSIDNDNGVHYYCHCCQWAINDCDTTNQFHVAAYQTIMGSVDNSISHYSPATKEQRDLLFAKMKEAGYEWDAMKKQPKKL